MDDYYRQLAQKMLAGMGIHNTHAPADMRYSPKYSLPDVGLYAGGNPNSPIATSGVTGSRQYLNPVADAAAFAAADQASADRQKYAANIDTEALRGLIARIGHNVGERRDLINNSPDKNPAPTNPMVNPAANKTSGALGARPQMILPESGTAYPTPTPPQYQPYEANYPIARSMAQPESGTPYPQFSPAQPPMVSSTPNTAQAPSIAAARPQEVKYANSPEAAAVKTGDQGKHFWLDKGDGSPLTPYYSKTGEKPNIPGSFAFEDPNYKPFFGLFGSGQ